MAKQTRKVVRPKPSAAPAPAAAPVERKLPAIAEAALVTLRKDGPLVAHRGGHWAKKGAAKNPATGHPVGSVPAFLVDLLVKRGRAEFTKFKPGKGGRVAVEVEAVKVSP